MSVNETGIFIVQSVKQLKNMKCFVQTDKASGSQTFRVRGPLGIIWWSAKQKVLICIGIRVPRVVRGADFGNHWTRHIHNLEIARTILSRISEFLLWKALKIFNDILLMFLKSQQQPKLYYLRHST